MLTLPTRYTIKDETAAPLRVMTHNLHTMANAANAGLARQERLFRKLTPTLSNAAKQLLSYGTAGLGIGAAALSGKGIMDYETAIQSLQAVTGVSDKALEQFKKEIVSTANESKKFAGDVAGSFEVIGSMMSQYLTDPKALNQISNAGITLAKASRQELVPTLENLTSIMNQFDIKAAQATETVNRLTAGEIVGSLRTNQVAESLQEFGAGAYSANVNLSESVALVEALAKQMKTDKIGVGARNILTVMDSAKGLDKKARRDLRRSGVDLNYLMDKTHSLSERLHELSKISGNATVITSVFGRENKTAAQVIFNQLGTYDEYLAKIKVTNEAQKQAATNSNTLMVRVDQLKNTWLNYIATGDKAAIGLNKLKDAVGYVTDNMDSIVSVGLNVIKVFALWKAAIVAQKAVTMGLNIYLGIQSALVGYSSIAMKENIFALGAQKIAMVATGIATGVTTGNFAALNDVLLANPIGLVVTGLVALAGALYLADQREKSLIATYKEKIRLNQVDEINRETDALKKQIAQYVLLGDSIGKATAKTIQYNLVSFDIQKSKVESRIKETKKDLEKEKNKLYIGDLFKGAFGGGKAMYGDREKLAEQLSAQQTSSKKLSQDKLAVVELAKSMLETGKVSQKDYGSMFNSPKSKPTIVAGNPNSLWGGQTSEPKKGSGYFESTESGGIDLLKMFEKIMKSEKQNITIELKGLPAGATATVAGNNSMPSVAKSY